ncbi:hypothetical protein [Amycolatopsis sp. CA-230715]|uniref:hypothetical protein n=1 Tax=Amycolatopsis sp. CA-230715 TaxID=2745196 RepID=UPI001C02437C|nr:hypothetical protein [Amycolatopsis sp. CA-230715]QWF81710.1 hypothetical protein HUW46_05143 [Amycolatopsis sp. CA-230715]
MRVRLMAGVWLAGAVVALAGCSNDDGGDKVASVSSPPAAGQGDQNAGNQGGTDEDKRRAFAKCMREHGVDMPDPQPGGQGQTLKIEAGDEGKMKAADDACRKLLPNGGEMKKPDAKELDEMRKQAKCMREHGVDMPDPDPEKPGMRVAGKAGDDPAKMEAAAKACGMGMGAPGVAGKTGK